MSQRLAAELLGAPTGVALLVVGEASGRLDTALADPGLTLCLAAHAQRELRRGTDDGRLAELSADPPAWLREAAGRVAARDDIGWWSRPALECVQRQVADGLTGNEVVDHRGRARSLAEEAAPHLHTFTSAEARDPIRRWRADRDVEVVAFDGPDDWDVAGHAVPEDVQGVHLTLRGALTIDHADAPWWPWDTAGTWWNEPVPGTPLSDDEPPVWRHDHDWVVVGRPFDPRFDEGDEVDGSELP